uniref:Uncharacterized protein n=1 Tax=Strombidium inclinatum TaxID=197538 RepID=A0A7S3IGW8_9SPIT|mmetsp:Transcript_1870/g.2568  ORF Transcript_1870/g.2568 Transcript_1870/m.2568 type:complete len:197 (+) Transcript_1870:759-1349(+)
MLALMRSQTHDMDNFGPFKPQNDLQLNLAHKPEHTFMFDSYTHSRLEDTLDRIKFFSSPLRGMTMNDFIRKEPTLSQIFIPVCSFHNDTQGNSNSEFVAAIEGVVYPWFGVAYRVDKIQFGMDINDHIDHSREAVIHAQKLANLFVDEARLSPHEYAFVSDEVKAVDLIAENDLFSVQVPLWEDSISLVRTEIYLF